MTWCATHKAHSSNRLIQVFYATRYENAAAKLYAGSTTRRAPFIYLFQHRAMTSLLNVQAAAKADATIHHCCDRTQDVLVVLRRSPTVADAASSLQLNA
jgi:hypothetical protein